MHWIKSLPKRRLTLHGQNGLLVEQELQKIGIDLDIPKLVRSCSSNSSLDSSVSDMDQGSQLICSGQSEKLHDKEPSIVQMLLTINEAIDEKIETESKQVRRQNLGQLCASNDPKKKKSHAKQRSICPQSLCKKYAGAPEISIESRTTIGSLKSTQTYPRSSLLPPRRPPSERIVTFCENVQVLEFHHETTRDCSHGWSVYFF